MSLFLFARIISTGIHAKLFVLNFSFHKRSKEVSVFETGLLCAIIDFLTKCDQSNETSSVVVLRHSTCFSMLQNENCNFS